MKSVGRSDGTFVASAETTGSLDEHCDVSSRQETEDNERTEAIQTSDDEESAGNRSSDSDDHSAEEGPGFYRYLWIWTLKPATSDTEDQIPKTGHRDCRLDHE